MLVLDHFRSHILPYRALSLGLCASPAFAQVAAGGAPKDQAASSASSDAAPEFQSQAVTGEPLDQPAPKEALLFYLFGEPEKALERLRIRALECGEPKDEKCSVDEIAGIHLAAGIVLAEAKEDHVAAVRMFRRALTLKPELKLPSQYDTRRAALAVREAQTGEGFSPGPSSPEAATTVEATQTSPEAATEEEAIPPQRDKSHWFIIAGLGAELAPISTLWGDEPPTRLVGSGTFLAVPLESVGLALGLRARFGMHLAGHDFGGTPGSGLLGGSVVLGSVVGPRVGDRFGFFLGGLGFETVPAYNFSSGVANFQGGLTLDGFSMAGIASLAPHAVEFGQDLYFGIELGFGASLFDSPTSRP